MDSTPSSVQAAPHHGVAVDDIIVVPQAVEPSVVVTAANVSAVPQVAEPSGRATASDVFAGPQAGGPSVLAEVRPAEFRNNPFLGEKPSRRAARAVTRFLVAVCIGVAGSLVWQAYGGAAREMIASRVPQLAWISSRPVLNQSPSPTDATGQAASSAAIEAPAAAQAASVAPAATDTPQAAAAQTAPIAQPATEQAAATMAAPTVPATPSPDQQQFETMSRDIGALRQSVEQLNARQEQMTRDMAKLQAAEMSRHRVSASPPHPTAAPARRPPPQVLSAVPSALPSPPLPPPPMSPERPQPAIPPQSAAPPQPAMAPQPLRPPMPVLGQP
jgi:hypothetical protein